MFGEPPSRIAKKERVKVVDRQIVDRGTIARLEFGSSVGFLRLLLGGGGRPCQGHKFQNFDPFWHFGEKKEGARGYHGWFELADPNSGSHSFHMDGDLP